MEIPETDDWQFRKSPAQEALRLKVMQTVRDLMQESVSPEGLTVGDHTALMSAFIGALADALVATITASITWAAMGSTSHPQVARIAISFADDVASHIRGGIERRFDTDKKDGKAQ